MREEHEHLDLEAAQPWRPTSGALAALATSALGLLAVGVLIGAYAAGVGHF